MKHHTAKVNCLRYVYLLDVDNRRVKSKFYGQKRIFYTGQTVNLVGRLGQHLTKVFSRFLRRNFPDARKKLVFVQQLWGDEYEAIELETKIKKLGRAKKLELISSEVNDLVLYRPFKFIVLRKFEALDEQELLKL